MSESTPKRTPRVDGAGAADLDALREAIDRVDRGVLELLNERARLAQQVGALKRTERSGIYRAGRERDLVEALVGRNAGPFPNAGIPAVFREIISACRSLEAELRVAYLGPEGTFSHVAARQSFGARASYVPVATIPDVIAALERGEADHGILPVENTSEGVVTATLDALLSCSSTICGEKLLRVSQTLMSQDGQLASVRRVASHPQPLAQCRGWLDRHLPGTERVETTSTVAAARLAKEEAGVAAIGSPLVAELEGLSRIADGIEDRRDNITRFVLLGGDAPDASGNDLTSIAYTVRKGESGALHRLLAPFAERGVNLTSIQARPLKGAPWEYVFTLDLEGHASDPNVQAAIEAAAEGANSYRVLGSFPRAGAPADLEAEE